MLYERQGWHCPLVGGDKSPCESSGAGMSKQTEAAEVA